MALHRSKILLSSATGYLRGSYTYVDQPVGRYISKSGLGGYYNDLTRKTLPGAFQKADVDTFLSHPSRRRYFAATTVAHMGLGWYDLWLGTRQQQYIDNAVVAADWLVDHMLMRDGMGIWQHNVCPAVYDHRGVVNPWISAMTQGESISLLLRVHQTHGRARYLEAARNALEAFLRPVEQGGVTAHDDDLIVFEEVPHNQPYSHVLNGWIYALWGVYDFALYTRDGDAQRLYEQALHSLKVLLPAYDTGYWSRYELFPTPMVNLASPFYHSLHIALLEAMWQTSELADFRTVAQRWRSYDKSRRSKVRAVLLKSMYKLVYERL